LEFGNLPTDRSTSYHTKMEERYYLNLKSICGRIVSAHDLTQINSVHYIGSITVKHIHAHASTFASTIAHMHTNYTTHIIKTLAHAHNMHKHMRAYTHLHMHTLHSKHRGICLHMYILEKTNTPPMFFNSPTQGNFFSYFSTHRLGERYLGQISLHCTNSTTRG